MRSLSWRLMLRVLTVLSWLLAIVWFIAEPGYEPLIAVVTGISTLLGSFAVSDAPISGTLLTPERHERNRQAMLELVRNTWVKGVFEQSLHGAAMIELALEEKADAVERPWDMVLQTKRENRVLRRGTRIIDVFDKMGGGLLILGAPGSGKTTTLLELARDTIACAEENQTQPIPVVFNLLSWAEKRQPIAEWLVDELSTKYNVPKKVARPWVENDDLLLLLDGLDEVKRECRDDCVRAINGFRQEHWVPLVVCSRIADYEALTAQLRLQGAVLLQPLTPQQVDKYLDGAGSELAAVRETLQHDTTLQELAQTPLMLSIMTMVYQGMTAEDLGSLDTTKARRKHILDAYVQRMFDRRRDDKPYLPEQTIGWLAWLAKKMSEHAQSLFLIERMQPKWLPTQAERQVYDLIVSLGVVLVVGLAAGSSVGLTYEPIRGLFAGLVFGFLSMLSSRAWNKLASMRGATEIKPVEVLRWIRPIGLIEWEMLIFPIGGALFFGLIIGLVVKAFTGRSQDLVSWLIVMPCVWLSGGFLFLLAMYLFAGLSSAELTIRQIPNEGIRQSAKNALVVVLLVSALGLIMGMVNATIGGERRFIVFGLTGGLALGIVAGMLYGGYAVMQHYALRFILYRSYYIPWNLTRFLDYAAERIFLSKVGGGYIFIHQLLQDHFASLY